MEKTHTFDTSDGPRTVSAAEPVPGLHVFEIPADVSPFSEHRWILAHHEGQALASFTTEDEATGAAETVAPLADWTRNAITCANEIGPAGMNDLMATLLAAGGQHPGA